jgi:peptidoglycan/xylan/chitin deacetylase (PgdA/CDA1 family)
VVVAWIGLLVGALTVAETATPVVTEATVNGRRVVLTPAGESIATLVRSAHLRVEPGVMYSIVGHRRLPGHSVPPVVILNGHRVGTSARVNRGDTIVIHPGWAVEPTVTRLADDPDVGLPAVEKTLWHPGRPASMVERIGAFSGAVLSSRVLEPGTVAAPETGKTVALTFDDGPDPRWTPQILAILRQKDVPATFCIIGYFAVHYPSLVQAEVSQGNTVCDHTADHDEHLDSAPPAHVADEIDRGADQIAAAGGVAPELYRPPGGALSPTVIAVAHARGLRVLYWSVDPQDWRRPSAPVIVSRIVSQARPGSIIILHDGGGNRSTTVTALGPVIDRLRQMGYSFTTPVLEALSTQPGLPATPNQPLQLPPSQTE